MQFERLHGIHVGAEAEYGRLVEALKQLQAQFNQEHHDVRHKRAHLKRELAEFIKIAEAEEAQKREGGGVMMTLHQYKFTRCPPEIGMLRNLEELNLDQNQLRHLPVEIGHLTKLKFLSLAENRLKELPGTIGNLVLLEIFYLQNNLLFEVPDEFAKLKSLESCHIHGNVLSLMPHDAPKEDGVELRDYVRDKVDRQVSQRCPPTQRRNGPTAQRPNDATTQRPDVLTTQRTIGGM